VQSHLVPGSLITQQGLDRPVLLLRDLPGATATANVTPGAAAGEADITVTVSPQGQATAASASFDNFGAESTGRYRFGLTGSIDNLSGYGDTTSLTVQPSLTPQSGEKSTTVLYRLGHRSSVGSAGTKAALSYSHSKYQLGGAFSTLQAAGDAKIFSGAVIHPLVRSRAQNVFLHAGADAKHLRDQTVGSSPERRVNATKLGVLGNAAGSGLARGGVTNYSLMLTFGRLDIRDPSTLAQDRSGPGTNGSFGKINLEVQRVEYLSDNLSLHGTLSRQSASKNLTSAEKLSLTGPAAVRGYGIDSESVVDSGTVISLELRRRLEFSPFGSQLSVSAFYDYADGDRLKNPDRVGATASNRVYFNSLGVGASMGTEGNYFLNATLARRLGGPKFYAPGSASDESASSKTQFWLSVAKVF